MKGNEFGELKAFVCVAEERSFRRAAERLRISPSALSHTIRALEERLGARLLNRTTRSVATTEAGLQLFDRVRPAIEAMTAAVSDVKGSSPVPSGTVRINLPRIAARMLITPMLAGFREQFPKVALDVVIDDAVIDIVGAGFDAGIRTGDLVQQDMVAVRLTPDMRMIVVGSSDYFSRRPVPQHPQELLQHPCLTYRWNNTGVLQRWRFQGPDGVISVNVGNAITVNETDFMLDAARNGVGLAYISDSLARSAIDKGELVPVLSSWATVLSGFHLYYLSTPHMPAPLRAFIDALKASTAAANTPRW